MADNVTTIGDNAFYNCKLTNGLTLPSSLSKIGVSAFNNCTGLQSVVIPEGVTNIGNFAFYECSSLLSVTIPSTIKTLGIESFKRCTKLATVNYNAKNVSTSYSSTEYYSETSEYERVNPFYRDQALTTFIIGDSVQSIPAYLCYGCSELTTLIFPRSVTSIGTYAFANCTKLATVTFEPIVCPTIDNSYTFNGCSALTTINIPCGYSYPSYQTKFSSYTAKLHYDLPAYTVSVSSDNTNFGTAAKTVEPNCDTYMAELTATPKTGYHFVRWSDNVTMNPYEVYLDKDTALRAFFEINKYNFKLQVNEAARGTVSAINGIYEHNTVLNFEATPNYGYHFTKWSDEKKNNPRTLTIVKDSTITAIFDPNIYTITCGTSAYGVTEGAGSYEYLTEITLTATPHYGYKFQRWSDGATINPRVVRVERDSIITAEYAPLNYQVVVRAADRKMGSVQPNSAEHPYLSEVELTAVPKYGYHFTEWSDGSNQNPYTIVVTKDTVFTANFAVNTYTVNILGSSFGTSEGAGSFDYLTDIQIEAIPNYGYKFKSWSDGIMDNPRILTVESDTTLSMVFEPMKYTLRTQSNNGEMGSVTPSVGKYTYLSEVEISAEPEYGYHFEQWSDGRIANPRTVTIERDTLFTAIFDINTYSIQTTTSNMGRVSGVGEYDYLSSCTLRATANYGYQFVRWSDGVTANPRTIVVTQDSILAAVYQPMNFTIEAYSSNNRQGSVTPETQEVPYLSTAVITANGVHGYTFSVWDDGNTDNPREITVTEDMIFIASFVKDSFDVVVNESEYGMVLGAGRYQYQANATIEAVSNYGYKFVSWSDGVTANPRTLSVDDNINLSVIFEPALFTIHTQSSNENRGQTTPEELTAAYLSTAIISAVPNYGYHFTQWNDGNTSAEREITITGDFTYVASFAPNTYSVYAVASPQSYGTAYSQPTGTYLEEVTISATPYDNYSFVRWSDGVTANPRTFTLTQDTAFVAIFEISRSGHCGDNFNLMWEYDRSEKMLTISGNGSLNSNYTFGLEAPNEVQKLIIAEGVTSIGNSAFMDYSTLRHVSIASTVTSVYAQAFYNCSGIEEIYSYRDRPSMAYSNTFDGVDKFNCTLHVLSASIAMYQVATGWRDFYYIESIDAVEVTETITEVETVPSNNDVTITWPMSENADTYTVEITKSGIIFCVLVFNSDGQLIGISFAPGRDNGHNAPMAIKTANGGLRFTVTGLESGTSYDLTVTVKDADNEVIESYDTQFETTGGTPTAIDQITNDQLPATTKILRNNQIFILRGEKAYTITGQEVR